MCVRDFFSVLFFFIFPVHLKSAVWNEAARLETLVLQTSLPFRCVSLLVFFNLVSSRRLGRVQLWPFFTEEGPPLVHPQPPSVFCLLFYFVFPIAESVG